MNEIKPKLKRIRLEPNRGVINMRGAKKYKAMNMKENEPKSARLEKEVPIIKDPMKNYRKRGRK